MREVERQVMLRIIDQRWREHLEEMDYLKEGINLRAMGQKDPLTEWQREGYEMFGSMMKGIAQDFVRYVMHVQVVRQRQQPAPPRRQLGARRSHRRHLPVAAEPPDDVVGHQEASGFRPRRQRRRQRRGAGRGAAPTASPTAIDQAPAGPPAAQTARPAAKQETVVKDEWSKTPRNAPCPCGSGKKFKMCHGAADAPGRPLRCVTSRTTCASCAAGSARPRRTCASASPATGSPSWRPRWAVPTCGTTPTAPRR